MLTDVGFIRYTIYNDYKLIILMKRGAWRCLQRIYKMHLTR